MLGKVQNMKDELWILGNGFDLAHNLPTSYKDFFNFIILVINIYKVVEEKERNNYKTFDQAVKQCSNIKLRNYQTILKLIKDTKFVKEGSGIRFSNKTIQALKRYLIGKSEVSIIDSKKKEYNIENHFLKYMYATDKKTGTNLFYEIFTLWIKQPNSKGIEEMLIELINYTDKLDKVSPEVLQSQLFYINRAFENYLKHVVFDILYKEEFASYSNCTLINRIKDFEENKENIVSILSFNYTCMLPIYNENLISSMKQPNGKIKTASSILGINLEDVISLKRDRYKLISKEAMRVQYRDILKNIKPTKRTSEYVEVLKKEWNEFLDDEGMFQTKKFLDANKSVEVIRVYGHSLGSADYSILRPLLTNNRIKKVIVYIYSGKREGSLETLLQSNECKNLLKMLYSVSEYKDLSILQKEEFNNKYILKSAVNPEPFNIEESELGGDKELYKDLYIDYLIYKQQKVYKQYDSEYKTTFEQLEEFLNDD